MRTTAQHNLNKKSNRSHSIFTVYVTQRARSGVSEKVVEYITYCCAPFLCVFILFLVFLCDTAVTHGQLLSPVLSSVCPIARHPESCDRGSSQSRDPLTSSLSVVAF